MTTTSDVGRKQQKLAYHMFTCKFPVSYITMSASMLWVCENTIKLVLDV